MIKKLFYILTFCIAFQACCQSEIPLVYHEEFTGAKYAEPKYPSVDEAPAVKSLPNPFEFSNSTKQVTKFKDWEKRRAEILHELEHYEVGVKPVVSKDQIEASLDSSVLTVKVNVGDKSLTLHSTIVYPEGDGPFPLMIGASMISIPRNLLEERKIAMMVFDMREVMNHLQNRGYEPVSEIYPDYIENGAYSKWPWDISRLIDGLEIVGEASRIDMDHIGVTGCSYAGKMALWAGALDERIALTIAQEPGGGGAAAWRVSEYIGHVETLGNTAKEWFKESMWDFAGEKTVYLPTDHHELCALVCPRALLVLGNTDYEWLADESGYISSVAALEVWKKFGIEDRMGYSIEGGHMHCMLPECQIPEVAAFLDKFLLGKEADTKVRHIDQIIRDKMLEHGITVEQFIPWTE